MTKKLIRKCQIKKMVLAYNIECVNPKNCGSNGVC